MSTNGHSEVASLSARGLFRIGQVSRLTDTKPFVLRYWETEFPTLQPVKSPKGHRLYRREDVDTVLHIKRLLYDEGFTIAGARRHLRDGNGAPQETPVAQSAPTVARTESHDAPPAPVRHADEQSPISRKVLLDLRDSLRTFLTLLENE